MSDSNFERMVTHALAEMGLYFSFGRSAGNDESEWRLGIEVEGGNAVRLHLVGVGEWLFVRASLERKPDALTREQILELQSSIPLARLVVAGDAEGILMAISEVHSSDAGRVPVIARAINSVAQLASDAQRAAGPIVAG